MSETCDIWTELHPMNEFQSTENGQPDQDVIRTDEIKDFLNFLDSNVSDHFKQFDILCNCSDHHFFNEGKGLALSQVRH